MERQQRRLGRTGLSVVPIGLGCWALGDAGRGDGVSWAGVDEQEAVAALRRGIELGANFLDTANVYGQSEDLIGRVVGDRPDIFVATKFGGTYDDESRRLAEGPVDVFVRHSVRSSLRRLRRDRIDLYQLHTPTSDPGRADDLIAVLEELVAEGAIAWYGVSTDNADQVRLLSRGDHFAAVQFGLNVFEGNPEILDVCDELDLGVLCRSPLAMGLLGGRYNAESRLPANDIRTRTPDWLRLFQGGQPNAAYLERLDRIRTSLIADGRTLAQGSLSWILQRHPRAIPIPGFRNRSQVEDNLGTLEVRPLSDEQLEAINQALQR